MVKSQSLCTSAYVTIGVIAAINVLVLLFVSTYLWRAKGVGISKQEIENLKNQNTHFIQIEGDMFCNSHATEEMIAKQNNIKFIKAKSDTLKELGALEIHNTLALNTNLIDYALQSHNPSTQVTSAQVTSAQINHNGKVEIVSAKHCQQ